MRHRIVTLGLLLSCVSPCIFAAKFSGFQVEHDTLADLNYGTVINFRFYEVTIKEKGKDKDKEKQYPLSIKDAADIKVKTTNCEFAFKLAGSALQLGGALTLAPRPKSLADSVCTVVFSLENKDKSYEKSFTFRLNYKGLVRLNYNGKDGQSPADKKISERLFNYTEVTGANGTDGEAGMNIQVNIVKQYSKDKKDSFYLAKVLDVDNAQLYEYKIVPGRFKSVLIESKGGKGGNGENGPDGVTGSAKTYGGNGGNGGNGGPGGTIVVNIAKNAFEIGNEIVCVNLGGSGGKGGNGGKGALADPTNLGSRSPNGFPGIQGQNGPSGPQPVITITPY
ncbi:MAG: hypothetical protein AB1458_11115 [Bacteroidota bacterium]